MRPYHWLSALGVLFEFSAWLIPLAAFVVVTWLLADAFSGKQPSDSFVYLFIVVYLLAGVIWFVTLRGLKEWIQATQEVLERLRKLP